MSEFLGGLSLSLRALSPRQALSLSPSPPAPETVHSIERRWQSGTPNGQASGGIKSLVKKRR